MREVSPNFSDRKAPDGPANVLTLREADWMLKKARIY
jgi:hypothetical protein